MSINRIGLFHLETLLWIDRLGTFAAAAERLNTTQPAISARVRELESHLGARLFRREGRTMSFTPAGRQLVRDCGPLWSDLQSMLLRCGGLAEASGVVRIGAGEIAAASCLPDFVSQLKGAMPHVSLELEIDLTANLIQQLLVGRADISFAAGPIAHPALQSRPIGGVSLVWLASPAIAASFHGDAGDRTIPIWSLASHSPIYGRMRDAIAASQIARKSLNLCNNARMMIDIAKAGGGIGIFPEPMARADLMSGALVKLEGMPALSPIEFHVARRISDNDPVIAAIFEQASALRLGPEGEG
ncbi:LysR family transcriptional regulator [Sphingobium sp. 22B]|uniref:LysR family transcriptional regulator n=1 Tax=unclassified Sphingobium TaxID=2611147 RepID=UPI00078596E3|nr:MULTISPECIES: LysR family transcriptional regulator [unclassified Sphingobium]KXU32602.1 LysR family transcriptional regulator [Sphingobium sp. AM]KYC32679.1 LysR family transcriptional regulator [Sphingobium sp. 22B]OAP29476.1 LysR family transcriptional regulator [Sphingobium sp. 20006FA]